MTPEQIDDALELAYESLKQDLQYWQAKTAPDYEMAHRWEQLTVCSEVRGEEVIACGDDYLVYDPIGQLVPRFGGGPGYDRHSIYDDEKGELLIAKAEDGDQIAHNVLCSIAVASGASEHTACPSGSFGRGALRPHGPYGPYGYRSRRTK